MQIARSIFSNYNEHLARSGEKVKYADFDSQPADFCQSNFDQAASLIFQVERLGYELAKAADCPSEDRVDGFSDAQIEILARWEHERWLDERKSRGWHLGETEDGRGDPVRRISPHLKPYDELDESVKEYSRQPMREIVSVLADAGFAVRKQ